MKRLTILFIATAAAWLPAAAPASTAAAPASTTAQAARGAKLEIRHTSLGSILTNGRGLTLYMFTRDSPNRDRCVAISGCTSIWPALTSNGRPATGHQHLVAGGGRVVVALVLHAGDGPGDRVDQDLRGDRLSARLAKLWPAAA